MNNCDLLVDCGVTKPLAQLTRNDIPQLIKSAALHTTILKVKAELDQFSSGIDEAGALHAIKQYLELFRCMFVDQSEVITAGERSCLLC